jgi:hypothetical protein
MVRDMLVRHLGIVSRICSLLGAQWNLGATSRISGRGIRVADLSRHVLHSSLFVTATLLFRRHWLGSALAFVAGGGIVYAMIYLLALSDFSGAVNLTADGIFLACTFVSLWQVGYRTSLRHTV